MTVAARVPGPKVRVFNEDGTSNLISLDYLPFGHAGGGKASSAVTSVPAGWSEITFTNLIFDQEVDENPTIFDAGGINIAIFAYLIRSILGITPNTLNNNFYYQQERVTGVNRESTRDITGWIGGSIRQSQTSRYDPDITYWRIKKVAFVQNGKWRVLQLNTDIAGPAASANIINTPTEHIYEGDPTFGAGVFGTRVTQLPANTDDVEVTSLNAQTSGMHIGIKKKDNSAYGLGRYTFEGRLIEILDPGSDVSGTDPRPLYNICKRVYVLKRRNEAGVEKTPIIIRKNTDGKNVPISIDISNYLTDDINPLKRSNTVKWSGISHDRQNKFLLTTYETSPQVSGKGGESKLIIIPTRTQTGSSEASSTITSFINGTKTNNANELAFVDEIGKRILLLNTTDDTWKTGSYSLYLKDKVTADISDELRNKITQTQSRHPLGDNWINDEEVQSNPLHAYNEYQSGVNNNLFPRYINNYSMAIEVGEFRSGLWRYEQDTFVFNSFKNTRDYQIDRSHNSTLYDKGNKIQYMYTPTFNASALQTIESGGPWRAITSKLSTSNRHELLAYNSNGEIDWYRWTGTAVEKARTLPLKGFSLQNVTGIEWIGNSLYVCDSGQYQGQIQKYSISTTDIQFIKTILAPIRSPIARLDNITCTITPGRPGTPGTPGTPGIPGQPQQTTSDVFYSGIYPIDEVGEFLSGKNYSLRVRISHSRYLDIGSLFFEASGPKVGPGK